MSRVVGGKVGTGSGPPHRPVGAIKSFEKSRLFLFMPFYVYII
jgi:hypothetical protein